MNTTIGEDWDSNPRWHGIERPYTAEQIKKLQGSVAIEHTLARRGAERLYQLLSTRPFLRTLGTVTGNQAVQAVKAGLEAIYLSGWQVAADGNAAGETYPDQSLYPVNSVPQMVRRINRALMRADQIHCLEAADSKEAPIDWFAPIVADAEAGFGGPLNVFELVKAMIEAGAAGIHLEDQQSSEKKCGHMGGKVLIPTSQSIRNLTAARLAMDVMGVPTLLVARTDARAATLITSDVDPRDAQFITGKRTVEGFFHTAAGLEAAINRGLAYAPHADILWCETSEPDLGEAREFAAEIHAQFPGKWLAYNCSPSFNWKRKLTDSQIATFQEELGELGYKFQFITLAGFHALNASMFDLARKYRNSGMTAYSELQEAEFSLATEGYTAVRHQREVGAEYFDEVSMIVSGGGASTTALSGSTEDEQFSPSERHI